MSNACSFVVNNNETDIVIETYNNRILLIITQYKKLGSIISVNQESVINEIGSSVFSVKTLFGKDDVEILAAVRYIAENVDIKIPLLISLALKEHTKETLKSIITVVNKIKTW